MGPRSVYDPVAIANAFILKSKYDLTIMQVLKLSYIAHGYHLAVYDSPLANELVQAWKYGPVFPSIYHTFKYQPPGVLRRLGQRFDPLVNNFVDVPADFDPGSENIIKFTFDAFGAYDGWKLSALTHSKEMPWVATYKKGVENIPIPNEAIRDSFKALLEKAKNHVR